MCHTARFRTFPAADFGRLPRNSKRRGISKRRKLVGKENLEPILAKLCVLGQDNIRFGRLSSDWVRHPDHCHLDHGRVLTDRVFHVSRIDLVSVNADDLF